MNCLHCVVLMLLIFLLRNLAKDIRFHLILCKAILLWHNIEKCLCFRFKSLTERCLALQKLSIWRAFEPEDIGFYEPLSATILLNQRQTKEPPGSKNAKIIFGKNFWRIFNFWHRSVFVPGKSASPPFFLQWMPSQLNSFFLGIFLLRSIVVMISVGSEKLSIMFFFESSFWKKAVDDER